MSSNDRNDLLNLANIIAEAREVDIPIHLVKIKSILQRHPDSSRERHDLKKMILEYDLLSWCAMVLNFEFPKTDSGLKIIVDIVDIICKSCTSINLKDHEELKNIILPGAVHCILFLAWRILEQYYENMKQFGAIKYGIHAEKIATLKTHYQSIMNSTATLVTSQGHLSISVLKSDNLIRLLIEDAPDMEKMQVVVLDIVQRSIRVNPASIESLPTVSLNHLLDELIFKITSSQDNNLVGSTVKILLMMVDVYPDLANKMTMRFKGLKALMTRWLGHGFDRNLKNLMEILDAGNAKLAELSRRTHAVKVIWAAYQGWKTRTRVAKLHKVIPNLQSSFRKKRQEKLHEALKEKLGIEQKYQTDLQKKRSVRHAKEKQLQMLEIVPASKISKHIQQEEEKAAIKIQSLWRGSAQRKRFQGEKLTLKQNIAAVTIQRSVRKFLERRRQHRQSHISVIPIHSKIPSDVREEYQMRIEQEKVIRENRNITRSDTEEIHNKTQKLLQLYHSKKVEKIQCSDPKLEALLAKLHTEEESLSNLPSLSSATKLDVDNLSSGSNAVAVAAEQEHWRTMREYSSSWWQKLSLKTGNNLDPFEEKIKPVFEEEEMDIENFLKKHSDHLLG